MSSPVSDDITETAQIINDGGVAVIPTDTCYGLAASTTSRKAVRRIFEIKKRPLSKPVICNISNIEQSRELSDNMPSLFEEIAEEFWPGPLTLILPASPNVTSLLKGNTDNIALRLPDCSRTVKLISKVGFPITSTSANISGYDPVYRISRLDDRIREMTDIILDGGELKKNPPSSLLDLTTQPPRLIREGEIKPEDLKKILDLETAGAGH